MSKRGIEVDPKKVIAITSMLSPHDVKSSTSLQGNIQAIIMFIAHLFDKYQPFIELLKKGFHFEWIQTCQQAFDNIKHYVKTPMVLIPLKDNIPFHLYF